MVVGEKTRSDLGLKAVLDKARFWDRIKDAPLNNRQHSVINRLLDGFEGKA